MSLANKVKTLALAAALATTGCYSTLQSTDAKKPAQSTHQQETPAHNKLDRQLQMYTLDTELTPARTETPYLINNPFDFEENTYPINKELFTGLAARYFGLPQPQRELVLFNDVLRAHVEKKELELALENNFSPNHPRSTRQTTSNNYQQQIQRLEQELNQVRRERDNYRSQANRAPRVEYRDRIVEQRPMFIPRSQHPVQPNRLFIRVNDDYYSFPDMWIVCPSLSSTQKACIDVDEFTRGFRYDGTERNR